MTLTDLDSAQALEDQCSGRPMLWKTQLTLCNIVVTLDYVVTL